MCELLEHILGGYRCFIIERMGTDLVQAMDVLSTWQHNMFLSSQMIQNDVSSMKVWLFLHHGLSVHYLVPAAIVQYIEEHGLYQDDAPCLEHTAEHKQPVNVLRGDRLQNGYNGEGVSRTPGSGALS